MKMKKILAGVLASTVAVSAMATSAFAVEETYKPTVGASWQGPMASKGNSAYQIDFGTGTTDSSSQEEIMGEPTTFGVDANGGEWVRFTVNGTWTPTLTGTATVVDFGVDGVPGGDNDTMRKVPVTFTADNPTTLLDESLPEDTYGYGVNVYLAVNRNSLQKAGYLNLDDTEYVMQLDLDMTYWGDEKEGDGVIEDGAANVVTGAVKKHSIDVIYSGTTPTSVQVFDAYKEGIESTGTLTKAYKNFVLVDNTATGTNAGVSMTTLASVWEDDDSMISETFVQHSNNFYDEYPANAKLIFTIKVTQDTDAADSTTPEDPTAPNTHAINWLIQEGEEAILANFAFALNWKQTGAMTHPEEVKVATDGTAEIVMDWDTLVKKAGTGNIFEWSYAVSDGTVPAGQKMELVSVKFVGEEGTTTTTPSTDADADADADADTDTEEDDIPKSGSAPVALALIPVALAAAVVIAKKKA